MYCFIYPGGSVGCLGLACAECQEPEYKRLPGAEH